MLPKSGERKRRQKFNRKCAYPACSQEFTTCKPSQVYHSSDCRLADYHETHIRITIDEWAEFKAWKESRV